MSNYVLSIYVSKADQTVYCSLTEKGHLLYSEKYASDGNIYIGVFRALFPALRWVMSKLKKEDTLVLEIQSENLRHRLQSGILPKNIGIEGRECFNLLNKLPCRWHIAVSTKPRAYFTSAKPVSEDEITLLSSWWD